MESLNISIAGMGQVGKELLKILPDYINVNYILVKNLYKHKDLSNATTNIMKLMDSDLIVDVTDDLKISMLLLEKAYANKIDMVMCNKEFVMDNLNLICGTWYNMNIYLHSIVCSKDINEFPPLNSVNIKKFLDRGLFKFRGGGAEEAAKFILSDILIKYNSF